MLKLYNTLTRKKEVFKPINKNKVRMFVCGITPYDYMHIGHAKTYVQFDIIARYLRYRKYNLFYLQNVTDIDDKIINRARELKKDPLKLAHEYERYYYEDCKKLMIISINKYARATEHIKEILSQVGRLIKRKYAYKIEDGYYYDLSKFKDYGKLSRRSVVKAEDSVSRIDDSVDKRNKGDFCLWKFSKKDEPSWKSNVGNGRPGWHIEDTAITEKYFGSQYDIHGGAIDLIFPHHEAEIAQMEAISGKKPLVRYWMHTGFLTVNNEKMSKSLGNFVTVRDILKKYNAEILRLFFGSVHYRSNIDFNENSLENARLEYKKFENFIINLKNVKNLKKSNIKNLIKETKNKFIEAMDDDFNVSRAFAVMFDFISKINRLIMEDRLSKKDANNVYKLMLDFDKIFGLNLKNIKEKKVKISKEIKELIEAREKARKNKDYKLADSIRNKLKEKGYVIEDSSNGVKINKL